jgi:glycogen(starch) synthase
VRILFVSAEHAATKGTGGVGSYVATMTKALASAGHEVHVLSCLPGGEPEDRVSDGVFLHTRPLARLRGLSRVVRAPKTERALRRIVANFRYARQLGGFDVVEAPDWQAEGLAFALSTPSRLVTHLHTPEHVLQEFNQETPDRDSRWISRLERTSARRSARVTCPARVLVDHLSRERWLGDRSVDIIRYPVDADRFSDLGDVAATRPLVLYVGRLERRKAPEAIVYALAELRSAGVDAEAVFVGRGSGTRDGQNYGDWVAREAARLEVTCTFAGETAWDDIPAWYAKARVVCVPSVFESFSMTAAEGMAAARPVVMTRTVGASEVIAHEARGQIISSSEPKELATSLSAFLSDPAAARSVGAANRERVIAECDPARVAEQRVELFEALSTSPGARRRPLPARG